MSRGNRQEEVERDDTDFSSNDWLLKHIFCGHRSNISRCINAAKDKKNEVLNRLVENTLKC